MNIRGFFVRAFRKTGSGAVTTGDAAGTFVAVPGSSQHVNCDGQAMASISHAENSDKSSVTIDWMPPSNRGPNDVYFFKYTVVQKYNKFWYGTKSQEFKLN